MTLWNNALVSFWSVGNTVCDKIAQSNKNALQPVCHYSAVFWDSHLPFSNKGSTFPTVNKHRPGVSEDMGSKWKTNSWTAEQSFTQPLLHRHHYRLQHVSMRSILILSLTTETQWAKKLRDQWLGFRIFGWSIGCGLILKYWFWFSCQKIFPVDCKAWSWIVMIIIVGLYETRYLDTSLCAQTTILPKRDIQIIP